MYTELYGGKFLGKTVIVTGHTGFKGSWLSLWLTMMGARVVGVSNVIPTDPSFFVLNQISELVDDVRLDVTDTEAVIRLFKRVRPDYVFHLAAQALVRTSYAEPVQTITANAIGTVNVLEAIRLMDTDVVALMITSDKAYNNFEWPWGYRETDRLGGKDPYSASKGMAELAIYGYQKSYYESKKKVRLGVARAGNVIGGGDWAADRIVPDCMRSWSSGNSVKIRNPSSTRPWQHVLEPLSGYLDLAAELACNSSLSGEAYNFGPSARYDHSVAQLIEAMAEYWSNVRWIDLSTPNKTMHEAGLLKLNCDKAQRDLNWYPVLDFKETVKMTVEWYKYFYEKRPSSLMDFSKSQINQYITHAHNGGHKWAINFQQ